MCRFAGAVILAFVLMVASRRAVAADYPARAVTLVVPYPPGGGVDAMARVVAAKLSDAMRAQFIVDNRPGAGGTIGTRAVAQAAPDGYTLLLGHTGTISINPSLYVHAGIDPRKQFAPIGLVASMPVALLANPSFPAKTVADAAALAAKRIGNNSALRRSAPAAICLTNSSRRTLVSMLRSFLTRARHPQ